MYLFFDFNMLLEIAPLNGVHHSDIYMDFNRKCLLVSLGTAAVGTFSMFILGDGILVGRATAEYVFIPVVVLSVLGVFKACVGLVSEFRTAKKPRAEMAYYSYAGTTGAATMLSLLIISAVFMFFYGAISSENWSWIAAACCAAFAALFYSTLRFLIRNTRPIELGKTSLCAVAIDGSRKEISWGDVKRIEQIKVQKFMQSGIRDGYTYIVVGPGDDQIIIGDEIGRLPDLIREINACVKNFKLPLIGFDRTDGAKKIIRENEKNPSRQRLLRGIEFPISELEYTAIDRVRPG